MARPQDKLAASLEALKAIQDQGVVAIRSGDLTRTHRERLLANGFLQPVMKGWYVPSRPDETAGESTAWYAAYWDFCASYLASRFDDRWVLSPEQSLLLHARIETVPQQLLIKAEAGSNNLVSLPHDTSLLDVRADLPRHIDTYKGLRLYPLPLALIECGPGFFTQHPTGARTVLGLVRDASELLPDLLERGQSTVAGRLAGAFRNIGRERIASEILETMKAAGYDVREHDPFESPSPILLSSKPGSPYESRLRLMWESMRASVIDRFPAPPGLPQDVEPYLEQVQKSYVTDAYHSLSIEGYRVTPELITQVAQGNWNPEMSEADRQSRDALAAHGYWEAHQAVRESLAPILAGKNPGAVLDADHGTWYRALFGPSVRAGILQPADLAGYRNQPVYIRKSMHVPPGPEAVRDAMPVFFELLRNESEPAVRVVLGHFIFVFVHPYMDGNGRIARFLMNAMLASGGYPWTVIDVADREAYMTALETASVEQDIVPFTDFIANAVSKGLQ